MRNLVFALLLFFATTAAAPAEDAAGAIRAVLVKQQAAWNRGDIDAFMAGYWRSEELRFASGSTVQRGWQATLERYRERYPDRAAMGELAFSDLEIEVLSDDQALVFGRWRLQREHDAPGGLFTLHFIRTDGGWLIAADHTSS